MHYLCLLLLCIFFLSESCCFSHDASTFIPCDQTERGRKIARTWKISIKIKEPSNFVVGFFEVKQVFGVVAFLLGLWRGKSELKISGLVTHTQSARTFAQKPIFWCWKVFKRAASHWYPNHNMNHTHNVRCTNGAPCKVKNVFAWDQVQKSFRFVLSVGSVCQNNDYPQSYCFASNRLVGVVKWWPSVNCILGQKIIQSKSRGGSTSTSSGVMKTSFSVISSGLNQNMKIEHVKIKQNSPNNMKRKINIPKLILISFNAINY